MQRGGLLPGLLAIVVESGADRFEFLVVELAQLFGEKGDLPLARDLLSNGSRATDFGEQVVFERHVRQLRVGQCDERLREFEHVERLTAHLASTRAVVFESSVVVAHGCGIVE